MGNVSYVDLGLFAVFMAVLLGPFLCKRVEENLEAFLLAMGLVAASVSQVWTGQLVHTALVEPVAKGIVPAVLVAGLAFHYGRGAMDRAMERIRRRVPMSVIVLVMVVGLGLASSVMTAIIAALVLVELLHVLPLSRCQKVELAIVACFSIGLGAVLTPLGEPLSTIAVTALHGEPYHAGFFFLFRHLAAYIIPWVVVLGGLSLFYLRPERPALLKWFSLREASSGRVVDAPAAGAAGPDPARSATGDAGGAEAAPEGLREVFVRAGKVYVFVAALIVLGAGMEVLVSKYFIRIPAMALYWANMVSAILDNATLTAAEIGPALELTQIKSALLGLLISGGMLIPGNIPNIISANKLKITSSEWARVGVPLGLVLMLATFVLYYLV